MYKIQDKIVLITGASSGIGTACAKYFAAAGAKLLLCARRLELLHELAKELHDAYGTKVNVFKLDVQNYAAVKEALQALPKSWQEIDILINNAGLGLGLESIAEGKVDDWDAMIDTNIKGLLYVTREVLPGMLARNHGHIVNLGSIAGFQVYPKGAVYCATKHAVRALSTGLRKDVLGSKIRVTEIDPGAVETNFSKVRFKGDNERAAAVYAGMEALRAEDIADAILYCVTRPPHVNISELVVMPTDQVSVEMVMRKVDK